MITIVCGLVCIPKLPFGSRVEDLVESKNQSLVEFGKKVRSARKEKKFSQEELASRADLHRTYIGMIERGEKNITLINILRISRALNISASNLLESIE
jgi:DNA-binding XRE family transcriptional regulator